MPHIGETKLGKEIDKKGSYVKERRSLSYPYHKRDDNRIENLQLVTDDRHKQISLLEAKIERLEKRNKELEEILYG